MEKPVTDHNSDKTCAEETKGQQLEDGATSCSEIETQKLDGAGKFFMVPYRHQYHFHRLPFGIFF